MKVTIEGHATTTPSRKSKAAICGFLTGIGKNITEAKASLAQSIKKQLTYGNQLRWIKAKDGHTLFLLYYQDGWAYDIMQHGYKHPSTCCMGDISQAAAIAAVEKHAENYS